MKWLIIVIILLIIFYNLKIEVSTTNASINSVLGLPVIMPVKDLISASPQNNIPIKIGFSL